jgi:UDP-sugar pyrophosphorylase
MATEHHYDPRCATVKAQERTTIMARISPNLLEGLDDEHKRLYDDMVNELGQAHLFASFLEDVLEDPSSSSRSAESFQSLLKQLHDLDQGYTDGGLAGYVRNAKKLLEDSRLGVNPLSGWVPSVPDGQVLEVGSDKFNEMERLGQPELGATGFVLVAGGLGERLGYSDIKVRILCV